jgi:hypothetical protein
LDEWKRLRPGHKITRVSGDAIDQYEAKLEILIRGDIQSHPSIGKTLNPQ